MYGERSRVGFTASIADGDEKPSPFQIHLEFSIPLRTSATLMGSASRR